MPAERPEYLLKFRPEPWVPVLEFACVKRLLKALLRAYGFRCLSLDRLPPVGPSAGPDGPR